MKQVFSKSGSIVVEEVPAPTVAPGQVLIKNFFSLISAGTESSAIQGTSESLFMRALKNPGLVKQGLTMVAQHGMKKTQAIIKEAQENAELLALGYSACGEVIGLGEGVSDFEVGDLVAAAGAGAASHAEVICVSKNLVARVPRSVEPEAATFTTVGAIALQGVRRSEAKLGERIVVTGLGLIGQITVQLLRAAGCQVFGIDTNEERIKLARKFGASGWSIAGQDDAVSRVLDWSQGVGADAVIITAGTPSSEPAHQAMQMIRRKGKVVIVGAVGMDLKRSPFYEKEADFLISTSYGPGRYDPSYEAKGNDYPIAYVRWTENRNMQAFLGLLDSGSIDMKSLTSKIYPIDQAPEAYQSLGATLKLPGVLIGYADRSLKDKSQPRVELNHEFTKSTDEIGVAMIGAGNFAKAMHLPNLKNIDGMKVVGICDRSGPDVKRLGKIYGAAEATTDYKTLLKRDDVDLVMITTRHNLHAPIAIESMRAGKDVFVEKPLSMNRGELTELISVKNTTKKRVMVGFNRRFSPLSGALKESFSNLTGPSFFVYRVNAGPLPLSHWTNDPVEGGGRIIGEGCHFIDYALWFVGQPPKRMTASKIGAKGINYQTNDRDNLAITIEFADGSIGQVLYTTLGASTASKERIEVYRDNTVGVIDDFKNLIISGNINRRIELKGQDKGHLAELELVRDALRAGNDFPIPFEESVRATIGSFLALEAAGDGKPVDGEWH